MTRHKAQGSRHKAQLHPFDWPLSFGLCALCLVALAESTSATVILPADFATVVEGSQLIVHGRVVEVRSQMTAGRRSIHSLVTVAVDEALKGSAGSTVTFRVPQGQVGSYRRIIVGAPEFTVGEEVVVFLTARPPAIRRMAAARFTHRRQWRLYFVPGAWRGAFAGPRFTAAVAAWAAIIVNAHALWQVFVFATCIGIGFGGVVLCRCCGAVSDAPAGSCR